MADPRARGSAAARTVGGLAVVAAAGTALLAIGHLGVEVPLLSAFGPGGDRAVPAAAGGFVVSALLYALIAYGAFTRAAWTWPSALVVNGVAVLGGVLQFRGAASAMGIVLSLAMLAVLLSPPGREAFMPATG